MGTVWRARDETLGRTVAVKELRFPTNIDEEEKRRLITRTLREAKAIARIRNNSAVTVFDVVDEDDRPWIVMELVEGKSLAEVIREDGVLEPKRAAEVGLAVLDVLRSAHREGILHRDVKPSNVLLESDTDRVVLTDFGIAQVEGDPSITSTGMLVGAPSYISPERARGHKPGPAADLWSLGGLLYASVEGLPPYDKGSAIATLTAVMTEPLEEPKNAGPLRDVIHGLLTKDPEQRLDDAGARAMLSAVLHAPAAPAGPQAPDATKVVPLPPQPGERDKKRADKGRSPGAAATSGNRAEEAGDRLRGALRSVRKAAAGAGAAGTAAASAAPDEKKPDADSGLAVTGEHRSVGTDAKDQETKGAAGAGRSSGWPVMPPPDLPERPVQRAPLTDVVSKRTLLIIAVAVALAVIGTVLAVTFSGDGGSSASGGGAKTSAGASAASGTKRDEKGGTRTDGGPSGSPAAPGVPGAGKESGGTPTTGTGKGGDDSGKGSGGGKAATTYKGSQGYSIGLPEGWKFQTAGSAGDRFTGPGGQKLLIAWTSTPKDDPVADWKNQERYMQRSQYDRIRIAKVDYRGWNTADWEFTYADGGTKYRTIDRGFVVDERRGYALMYTARADDWESGKRRSAWSTLAATFEPKP
ncbi:serine/threonine protein kinase [Streptomyces zinciresistens K42]|uniref:non-specific serine/threonine protein kinase n=2 Tax=Streptomyces TaxID=1883 RepID=G2GIM2_9ACTN|nr:serine/threonine protein kinase [Streptomyces zinciresistens K42]